MKKYLLLALVLVLTLSLFSGCRGLTEDESTGPNDNSSVGDNTAGSTPVPTVTLPSESSKPTDPTDNSQGGSGAGNANGGSNGGAGGSGGSAGGAGGGV